MERLTLFLLVAIGISVCGCLGTTPCAPPTYSSNFTLVMGGQVSLGERGELAIDYNQMAMSANVSGVTGSLDSFAGRFMWFNTSGWWIQQDACYPINEVTGETPQFSRRCLPDGGNSTSKTIAGVDATVWILTNDSIAMTYMYTTANEIPINFQMFQFATTTSLANVTGLVYQNPASYADPGSFVVPSICAEAAKKVKPLTFDDIPGIRSIKALLWNF